VSVDKEITTLGRGGSDTSAVALAAAFGCACEIFTDVDGVFTADPRKVPLARKIESLDYRTMAQLARLGAQVLSARSVDLAARFDVPVTVRSSFSLEEGTLVNAHDVPMEGPHVAGIAHKGDVALIEIKGADTPPGAAAAALALLEASALPLELLTLEANKVERVRLSWIAPDEDANKITEHWDALTKPAGRWALNVHRGLALVSLVGHGLADDSAFALDAARRLGRAEVQVRGCAWARCRSRSSCRARPPTPRSRRCTPHTSSPRPFSDRSPSPLPTSTPAPAAAAPGSRPCATGRLRDTSSAVVRRQLEEDVEEAVDVELPRRPFGEARVPARGVRRALAQLHAGRERDAREIEREHLERELAGVHSRVPEQVHGHHRRAAVERRRAAVGEP
jgi:hypothetical protein